MGHAFCLYLVRQPTKSPNPIGKMLASFSNMERLIRTLWAVVLCLGGVGLWGQSPVIRSGAMDLSNHPWHHNPTVDLAGKWLFHPNFFSKGLLPEDYTGYLQEIPATRSQKGLDLLGSAYGEYQLTLVMGNTQANPLGLQIEECLSAYEVLLNGQLLGGNGQIGTMRLMTQPGFGPKIFPLPQEEGLWDLRIRVSNFHHRRAGFQEVPRIGTLAELVEQRQTRMVAGAILIGLAIMNLLFQAMRFLNQPFDLKHLFHALWSACVIIHLLCLHERWLYVWAGEAYWEWIYRLELISLLGIGMSVAAFFRTYLREKQLEYEHLIVQALLLAQMLFVLFWPIHKGSWVDRLIPFDLIGVIGYQLLLVGRGIYRKETGSWVLGIATLVLVIAAVLDGVMGDRHVGNLVTAHYVYGIFLVLISWEMVRTTAKTEYKVKELAENLEKTQETLEKQAQNEEERELAHQQALEQVRKQSETVATHQFMKMNLARTLIGELEEIIRAGGDDGGTLRALVTNLRGQLETETRMEVLQQDTEAVNQDFFQRLAQKYPQLSKTEREICAYIKLNLSTKEMALIRKTTVNTLNVTRHRIRKKMGLERDEELVRAIQEV